MTVFAGFRLLKNTELYVDPELAGGSGFNKTTGIAGFPNGEIYRVDDASPKWSLARMYVKQTFSLARWFAGVDANSLQKETLKDDKNQLADTVDVDRLTIVAGRFALNDFLDNNTYSHDPRTQFLNWALMDYGAWDYAADTRGYSWGLYFEWNRPKWSLRWATVMVPHRANQMDLDTNFLAARGDNLEFEQRYTVGGNDGACRVLVFENHANMGDYRTTLNTPSYNLDITQSRSMSVKYGVGFNIEQALSQELGVFLRASWNDGHTETWAFTEVDQSLSFGASLKGNRWHRDSDSAGAALIINGLSNAHRDYLTAGGYGFVIGDGHLNYANEAIAEVYYLYKVKDGLDLSGDVQYVQNPAYNADRGPVSIASARLHYEM